MKYSIFLFCSIFFAASPVFSQDAGKWLRINFGNGGFSVAVPKNNIVDAEDRDRDQRLRIVAFENGVEMEVVHRKPAFLPGFINAIDEYPEAKKETLYIDDFTVIKSSPVLSRDKKIYRSLTIVRKKNFYSLTVRCNPDAEKNAERFFLSILIGDKPLIVKDEKTSFQEESVDASTLKTSPQVAEAGKRKSGGFEGKTTYRLDDLNDKFSETENLERRALIIDKPFPRYTPNGAFRELHMRLKIQFRADGQIGDIVVLSNEDKEFAKNSINAARRIKFVPAQRDGKAVESFQIVDYSMFGMPDSNVTIR